MRHGRSLWIILVCVVCAAVVCGQASPSSPGIGLSAAPDPRSQPVQIRRFDTPPAIDGHLADAVWAGALILKDFYQLKSGENVPATLPTEVLLGYDDKFLYVGFRAPGAAARASLSRRDEIFGDDTVRIVLDTFYDKQRAYVFVFNPYGIVADGIFTEGAGDDFSLTIPLTSKGVLNEKGYSVEAAIPFASLRYKAGNGRLWGINVLRNVKHRNNELNSWMPMTTGGKGLLAQSGELAGLDNISPRRSSEVIATMTASKNQSRLRAGVRRDIDNTGVVGTPPILQPGFTAKFNVSPALSVKVAVNPGYLAGTELFRPSAYQQLRRAAFDPDYAIKRNRSIRRFAFDETYLDSLAGFATPLGVVSKYALFDPDYVVELTGKKKAVTYDLLLARDPGPGDISSQDLEDPRIRSRATPYIGRDAYLNAFRLKRDIATDSSVGVLASTYSFAGTRSYSAGVDGRLRLDDNSLLSFQVMGVNSKRPFFDPDLRREVHRAGKGLGYYLSYDRQTRNLGVLVGVEGRTRDYRADLGFTRRYNYNRGFSLIKYRSDIVPDRTLVRWQVSNRSEVGYDFQGRLRNFGTESKLDLSLPRETYLSFGYDAGYEKLLEEDFGPRRGIYGAGAFLGAPERSTLSRGLSFYAESTPNERFSMSAFGSYKWGEFDLDYDAGPRFPRVSPAGLLDPDAPLDPHPGRLFYLESAVSYRLASNMRFGLEYSKIRLERDGNGRVAFDDNSFGGRYTYNLSDSVFIRTQLDYSTLSLRMRSQLAFGIAERSGRSFFAAYNDDRARAGYGPFFTVLAPSFRTNGRTILVKLSYPVFSTGRQPAK